VPACARVLEPAESVRVFGDLGDEIPGNSASITSASDAGAVKAVVRLKRPAISSLVFWANVSRSSVDVRCSGLVEIV
jgi:hypothetical protein